MKLIKLVLIKILIFGFFIHGTKSQKVNYQSIEVSELDGYTSLKNIEIDKKIETRLYSEKVKVTFKCKSCKIKNKFKVSGPDEFTMERIKFPLEKKLKPGKYQMTYWQKNVQQINLPFTVKENSENIIQVKD
ncbi:MAG: hypothetical protein KTR26_17470 [Flammeovirgaceae bacterium]|nr:hypothetical protein [Flammeovirgaceae bacterium]